MDDSGKGASVEAQDLMSTREVAAHLRVRPQTLKKWRILGTGPRFVKIGFRVFYRSADIKAWIDGRLRTGTSTGAVR